MPSWDQLQEALRTVIIELLKLADIDVIDPEDQAVLNQEKNSKEVAFQVVEEETGILVTFTRDGTAYYDRNGDGAVDLKIRTTDFGQQYDTGDGTGWRDFPPSFPPSLPLDNPLSPPPLM